MLTIAIANGWCMIKIFWGAGVVTPSKPPPPYEQLLPLPTPYFKMFLERSLNDPPPHTTPLQPPFAATPLPIHHPFPPKNFDCTPGVFSNLKIGTNGNHPKLEETRRNEPKPVLPTLKPAETSLSHSQMTKFLINYLIDSRTNVSNTCLVSHR